MFSELECGVCYRTYNAGRRCPRELRCRHTFCESCLRAMLTPASGETGEEPGHSSITCPLCRSATPVSGGDRVRAELRVDECVLERLMAEGVLDREDEEEEEEDEGVCDEKEEEEEEARTPDVPAEESDSLAVSRGGTLRRSWKKVWRVISGKSPRQNCIRGDDMRDLALMACYMY